MATETGTLATTDRTQLNWTVEQPESPVGTVWLIHGLGEHSGRYDHVVATLNEAGFRTVRFDLRGHGTSTGNRVFVHNYGEFMNDLAAIHAEVVAPRSNDGPLVLLGHSMGGNLAVGYALRHQNQIDALALSGPLLVAGSDVNPVTARVVGVLGRLVPALRIQSLPAESISRDPAVVTAYENDPLVFRGKVSAGLAAALLGEMSTFPDRYRELTIPVLVMHGTDDRLTDPNGSRLLAAGATNTVVTTHFYDGLYHEIFNEPSSDAVLADLIAWLQGVAATDE